MASRNPTPVYRNLKQPKIEIETISLDPARVELIKEILKQNALILEYVVHTYPELKPLDLNKLMEHYG